jgi:hypothetical protein
VPNDPPWAINELAKKEEKNWPDEDALRGIKRKNDILWHKVYGIAVVVVMVVLVAVFIASLAVWVIHYITPWHFLSEEQLSKIQSVIFSGSLGAVVSTYMQKQLSK